MSIVTRDNGIRVGKTAYKDPVLARASLQAATMIKDSMRRPPARRFAYIMSCVRQHGPRLERNARSKVNDLVRKGVAYDQAVFDAVRMTLADKAIDEGLLHIAQVLTRPNQAASGLGNAQDVGCAIVGGVTAVGGFIASIFGGSGGGSAVGSGGSSLAEGIGCNDAGRAAAARNAQLEAQAAADQLAAAREMAAAQVASAKASVTVEALKGKRYTNLALIGGGVLLVFGLGYFVMKV